MLLGARAKVNLFLDVLRRRDDGYHEIASVMATISLADEVELEPLGSPQVEVEWEGPSPAPSPNICEAAVLAFRERFGWPPGARVRIRKAVPVASGLGGGSADAAAVLLGLSRLSPVSPSRKELLEVALKVGADVPFLVVGGAALCRGVGEVIEPLRHAEYWLVLCGPGFGVSAREAYSLWDEEPHRLGLPPEEAARAFEEGRPEELAPFIGNALLPGVMRKYPAVGELLSALEEAGAMAVSMTGSGPAVFGLARSEEHAERICRRLREEGRAAWVEVARTVPVGVEEGEPAASPPSSRAGKEGQKGGAKGWASGWGLP